MRITAKVSAMIGMELVELPAPRDDVKTTDDAGKLDPAAAARALSVPGVTIGSKDDLAVIMFGWEVLHQAGRICDERHKASGKTDGACGRRVEKKNQCGEFVYVRAEIGFDNHAAAYRGRVSIDDRQLRAKGATDQAIDTANDAADELALLFASIMLHIGETAAKGRFYAIDTTGHFKRAQENRAIEMAEARQAKRAKEGGAK